MRDAEELPEEEFTHDRDNREIPFSTDAEHIWEAGYVPIVEDAQKLYDGDYYPLGPKRASRRAPAQPATEGQALMEAAPGSDPAQSSEGLNVSRDRVAQAVDRLEPRQQWVVEAHMWRGMSFAEIAEVLGVNKARAHQIYDQALGHLRTILTEHTEGL